MKLGLSLQYVIWWWRLGFTVECVPLLTTKFDWSVKIESIQEVEVAKRWVGSGMSWWKACKDVRASRRAPSSVVLSFFHQEEHLALKSPRIIVKQELDDTVVFKMSSKISQLRQYFGLEIYKLHQYIIYNVVLKLHK